MTRNMKLKQLLYPTFNINSNQSPIYHLTVSNIRSPTILIKQIFVELNSMSYITFGPNEIVYIRDIGYATLLHCGSRNTISQKVDDSLQKKESIYFDPDLFNSDADSNKSKKSQNKSDDEKNDKKPTEPTPDKKKEEEPNKQKKEETEKKIVEENVNIVKARLEGSQATVYTSEKNITKSIIVRVKSFLLNKREQIAVDIEINKTVDTLRKMIFQQLGEPMNNYHNIKLFTTSPAMTELTVHSKTIINCQIKDNAKLILTADYAFTFRPLPPNPHPKYKITLNANTLTSTKIIEEPKKADEKTPIALPPPPQQNKTEQKQLVVAVEQKKEEPKKQEEKPKMEKRQSQHEEDKNAFHTKCTIDYDSGKRYWELKIQKAPIDEDDLLIGLCIESDSKELSQCWNCDYVWAYQAVSAKKVTLERDPQSNLFLEESEHYGYAIKQSDTVGILLTFKARKAVITFYKNSISCGEAFMIDLDSLKTERKQLTPFVNIGGEAQVILDSKAPPPLDSYRLK